MSWRAAIVLCAGLAACGAPAAPVVSMSLALTGAVAARISEIQVSFVKLPLDSPQCVDLKKSCVKALGVATTPTAEGRPAFVAPYAQGAASVPMSIEVEAGRYRVAVEALDVEGRLVANACELELDLVAGQVTRLDQRLTEFTGTCDARL